jgi:hypothetical protein
LPQRMPRESVTHGRSPRPPSTTNSLAAKKFHRQQKTAIGRRLLSAFSPCSGLC